VQKGGHDVETARALARYHRSHRELSWFARMADTLIVLDNSSATEDPRLLASKTGGGPLNFTPGINPAVDEALRMAFPEAQI
jgi:predicted ABC-type ATPase